MASDPSIVDYICGQLSAVGEVRSRKMFGEFGVYCDGTFVGIICRNTLFIKPAKGGKAFANELELRPAYPSAKPSYVITEEKLEDTDWLVSFMQTTITDLPKKK